ncbi:STAS domain-containing protein [Azoarcus taiwanensis]|uniref:STAS domain-containing protein n=1 Tax=Azoarcus taiwanensis TaxID=666964 RepID=A0A972FCT5_9RHOO|nr:STAS domain-containing protein [Azoarcus taiwanensis]NMG04379.1 STAS domain-containing protein [Azoarcus taiwanensis]
MELKNESGRLCPEGELTIYSAAECKDALLAALEESDGLEIDLGSVTEIDTAGVQLLILLKSEAKRAGKTLTLSRHSAAVIDLTELFNLAGWFGDPLVIPAER